MQESITCPAEGDWRDCQTLTMRRQVTRAYSQPLIVVRAIKVALSDFFVGLNFFLDAFFEGVFLDSAVSFCFAFCSRLLAPSVRLILVETFLFC